MLKPTEPLYTSIYDTILGRLGYRWSEYGMVVLRGGPVVRRDLPQQPLFGDHALLQLQQILEESYSSWNPSLVQGTVTFICSCYAVSLHPQLKSLLASALLCLQPTLLKEEVCLELNNLCGNLCPPPQ